MQMAKLTENAIEYQTERIKLHTSLLCKKSCSIIFPISEAHHYTVNYYRQGNI